VRGGLQGYLVVRIVVVAFRDGGPSTVVGTCNALLEASQDIEDTVDS
jgi:hypothetical protein